MSHWTNVRPPHARTDRSQLWELAELISPKKQLLCGVTFLANPVELLVITCRTLCNSVDLPKIDYSRRSDFRPRRSRRACVGTLRLGSICSAFACWDTEPIAASLSRRFLLTQLLDSSSSAHQVGYRRFHQKEKASRGTQGDFISSAMASPMPTSERCSPPARQQRATVAAACTRNAFDETGRWSDYPRIVKNKKPLKKCQWCPVVKTVRSWGRDFRGFEMVK